MTLLLFILALPLALAATYGLMLSGCSICLAAATGVALYALFLWSELRRFI